MALLEVLKFPDPRLRKKAKAVEEVTPEIQKFAQDLLETMYHAHGIGLAATQVGELKRVLVIDIRPRDVEGRYKLEDLTELERQVEQPLVVINPEIIKTEGKTTYDEGCLSVPTFYETVQRFEYVEVKCLNLQGEEVLIKTDGLLAICLQHEMDHLEGKLFIDRLSLVKSNRIKNKIKKFGYPEPDAEGDEAAEKEEAAL